MLWLCLRFARLPLEIFTRNQPDSSAPASVLVIIEQHRVHCCNKAAEDLGIKINNSWATACTLSPDAKAIERSPKQEQEALQALAHWCYQFTPAISLQTPNKLLLEIGASLALFDGLKPLLARTQQGVNRQGYSLALGLAHTPKAAVLMSHCKAPPDNYSNDSLIPENFKRLLYALPVSTLDVSDQLIAKLCRTGFESLSDVFRLPYAAAGKRYGKAFVLYLKQVQGELADPQATISLPDSFSESLLFLQGITETEALLFPLRRLLSSLCTYLRVRQLQCSAFTCLFTQHSGKTESLTLNFSQAQNNAQHFLLLLQIKLENFRIDAPIESITLQTSQLSQAQQSSASLFADNDPSPGSETNNKSAQLLLDKLGARLSANAVQGLCIKDSHIPEYASQIGTPNSKLKKKTSISTTNHRPAWLLNKPIPIQCRQQTLYWHGKLELIKEAERIEGNWWQKPVQRDYFVARHEDGSTCWVFQDRLSKRWFVQGLFA